MKAIVVSDIHLTDKFEVDKFKFLFSLFSQCDQLIVNGDFWTAISTTFDEFLNSDWKQLFPLMLEKKAVYIFGNHDRRKFMDERMKLFSVRQVDRFDYISGTKTYHIEHGHLFFKHQSMSGPAYLKFMRLSKFDERVRKPVDDFLYNSIGIAKLVKAGRFLNARIKSKAKQIFDDGKVLVVGHTHFPEIDAKLGFVDTGFIDYGHACYLEIDGAGFSLKTARY